jgi:hypothetical protein
MEKKDCLIRFTAFCPVCGSHDIEPAKLAGIVSNRKLSIASEIVIAKNQLSQLNPKKEQASILLLDARIEKMEKELFELGETHI